MLTLEELKKLKLGSNFKYKGQLTKVDWREQDDEMVGLTQKGEEMWVHHFAITFQYNGRSITLRSMHPSPKIVELKDYSL